MLTVENYWLTILIDRNIAHRLREQLVLIVTAIRDKSKEYCFYRLRITQFHKQYRFVDLNLVV